jgi:hypothetical protein
MPWGRYLDQARIIGVSIGVRTLEQKFWEEVGRSRSLQEDELLGNIKEG